MAARVEGYRAELRVLQDWGPSPDHACAGERTAVF